MIGAIILQIVLILLNAVFASAEIAVISMNETKLKHLTAQGNIRAKKLTYLTKQPARFLATIQVAITLAGLLGSAFAAENFATPITNLLIEAGVSVPEKVLKTIMLFVITVVLSYFSLVFGELVPKRLAMKKTEAIALGLANLLYAVSKIIGPLVFILTLSTNGMLRLLHINPEEDEEKVTEEEILMLLAEGSEQGTIDAHENEFIQNVFAFDDISAEQICTHRMDVVSLNADESIEEWNDTIIRTRHTHYPVFKGNQENIIGVLDTKDYFRLADKTKENALKEALEEAYFIPENMKASTLFQNMRQNRDYFAILIDEYGGFSGIITLHDLMEELVGDLDEPDEVTGPEDIEQISDSEWKIMGNAYLEDVAKELNVKLPTDQYDTFNGFICGVVDRIPNDNESFTCDACGLHIRIHAVKNHRVIWTTVAKTHMEEKAEN